MPAKRKAVVKTKRKKVKKEFKSKADTKFLVDSLFGPDAVELEPKGNYWSPEKAGDAIDGEFVRSYTDTDGHERIVVKPEDSEEMVLPSHTLLMNLLRGTDIGDFLMVVCIYVGTGRGDPYEYRAAVVE